MPSGPRVSRASTPAAPAPRNRVVLEDGCCNGSSSSSDGTPRKRLLRKTSLRPAAFDVHVPEELLCPVLKTLIRDPVVNVAGNTYDREALHRCWDVTDPELRDPLTNQTLKDARTIPNWDMRRRVQAFLDANPGYIPDGWPDQSMPCSMKQYAYPGQDDDLDRTFTLIFTFGLAGLGCGCSILVMICHSAHYLPGYGFQTELMSPAMLGGTWILAIGFAMLALGFALQKLGWYEMAIVRDRLIVTLLMYIGFVLFVIGAIAWDLPFLHLDALTLACTVVVTAFAALLEVDWNAMTAMRRLSAWLAWSVAVVLLIARLTKTFPEAREQWITCWIGVFLFATRLLGSRVLQEVLFWAHDLRFVLLVFGLWNPPMVLSAGALAISYILTLLNWEFYGEIWRATVSLAQVGHISMCVMGIVVSFAPILSTNVWSLCFAAFYMMAVVVEDVRVDTQGRVKWFVSRFAWCATALFASLGMFTWLSCTFTPDETWPKVFGKALL